MTKEIFETIQVNDCVWVIDMLKSPIIHTVIYEIVVGKKENDYVVALCPSDKLGADFNYQYVFRSKTEAMHGYRAKVKRAIRVASAPLFEKLDYINKQIEGEIK